MAAASTTSNGNPQISDDLFKLFAKLIYDFAGIRLTDQKKTLVTSRFQKRLRTLGLASYSDYYKMVKANEDERVLMLNSITTNTTNFFRENHHFEYLRETVIPELLQTKHCKKEIRIWSAGCSSGEEPYSIAISVCEAFRDAYPNADPNDPFCGWEIKILATDISTKVLAAAQSGVYGLEQIPAGQLLRHGDGKRAIEEDHKLPATQFQGGCLSVHSKIRHDLLPQRHDLF